MNIELGHAVMQMLSTSCNAALEAGWAIKVKVSRLGPGSDWISAVEGMHRLKIGSGLNPHPEHGGRRELWAVHEAQQLPPHDRQLVGHAGVQREHRAHRLHESQRRRSKVLLQRLPRLNEVTSEYQKLYGDGFTRCAFCCGASVTLGQTSAINARLQSAHACTGLYALLARTVCGKQRFRRP